MTKHTFPSSIWESKCVLFGPGHLPSVGLLAATTSLVFITTPSVGRADTDRLREEIWVLPTLELKWRGPSTCLHHILSVLTYPSPSPWFSHVFKWHYKLERSSIRIWSVSLSGMDSLLVMYRRLQCHQGNFLRDVHKGKCGHNGSQCKFQAGRLSLKKIWGSLFTSSFSLTLHQPESLAPQPRLPQKLPGTL